MLKKAQPNQKLVIMIATMDRFLKILGGMIGSLAYRDSTTHSVAINTTVKTRGTMTAGDFQGNVWPPKFIASKNNVANERTSNVPM